MNIFEASEPIFSPKYLEYFFPPLQFWFMVAI